MNKAFVNSLPKSGTNLLAKCLLLFGYKERGHISAGTILDSTPRAFIRRMLWKCNSDGYLLGVNSPVMVRKSPIDSILRKVKEGQFISGHVGYQQELLDAIIANGFTPIQVIRDPRAVLASFVPYVLGDKNHFLHKLFKSLPSDERYKAVLDGVTENISTQRSLKQCCEALDHWLNTDGVIVVKFEDIVGDQGGGSDVKRLEVLERLSEALNIPRENISQVAENLYGPGRHTFRKGRVDSWKEEISDSLLERISVEMSAVLDLWGYDK